MAEIHHHEYLKTNHSRFHEFYALHETLPGWFPDWASSTPGSGWRQQRCCADCLAPNRQDSYSAQYKIRRFAKFYELSDSPHPATPQASLQPAIQPWFHQDADGLSPRFSARQTLHRRSTYSGRARQRYCLDPQSAPGVNRRLDPTATNDAPMNKAQSTRNRYYPRSGYGVWTEPCHQIRSQL